MQHSLREHNDGLVCPPLSLAVVAHADVHRLNARQRLKSPHSGAVHSIPLENMRHGNFAGGAAQVHQPESLFASVPDLIADKYRDRDLQ